MSEELLEEEVDLGPCPDCGENDWDTDYDEPYCIPCEPCVDCGKKECNGWHCPICGSKRCRGYCL